ncbi:MAG: type II secretion system protein GspC [Pseudomonadota bacterium]|nr:type II secretion system protein GspC [Pseudomonadota bacterium]
MPEPSAASTRRRILLVFGVVSLLGFGGGALANQGVARLLALPEDATLPEYVDAVMPGEGGPMQPGGGPGVAGGASDPDEPEGASTKRSPPRPRALSQKSYSEIIVRRNIFDSTAVYDPNSAKSGDVAGECKSDSNVRLLATVVADPPTYSSALIATGGARDAKADGYAIGDDVGGEGRITLIEQKKVCLDGGTCICIGGDTARPALAAGEPTEGGISKDGETTVVEQSVIDEAMNNFEQLATQVRVVPHKGSDGAIDGYRLSAIRKGSLFEKLGIKNGDIVHGVNGQALTSTEGALSIYQTLRNERSFTFDITRRNQRQSLGFEVR